MKSPLFGEHFQKDNWTLVYFNALREAFTKSKAKTALEALLGKKKSAASREEKDQANQSQRLMDFGETLNHAPAERTSPELAIEDVLREGGSDS